MKNLEDIVQYYLKGIMNEYSIKEQSRAEEILANALHSEKVDRAITEFVESELERE